MNEQDLADVLCCSERKLRDMRMEFLTPEKHWEMRDGHVWYLDAGIHEMEAALGLAVGIVSKTLAGQVAEGVVTAAEKAPQMPEDGLEGMETKAAEAEGQDGAAAAAGEVEKMVMASIVRTLPNARVYVAQVVGTKRIVRLRTKARMGLTRGRKLWCVDMGSELIFDRVKARMMGRQNATARA